MEPLRPGLQTSWPGTRSQAVASRSPRRRVGQARAPAEARALAVDAEGLGPWPAWVNRGRQPIPGIGSDSLSSDPGSLGRRSPTSSSRSSSASSRSAADGVAAAAAPRAGPAPAEGARRERRWRLTFRVHRRLTSSPPLPPARHVLHSGIRRRRTFVHVPGLVGDGQVQELHRLQRHPSVQEVLDRRYSLNYHHTAYRVELPMRAHCRDLYSHLVDTMVWADQLVWKRLARNETVYPQAEYIVYDARDGEPGTIEPHVDNNSAVSMIVLLSDPSEFSGGTNYFDGDGACPGSRPLDLQRGDAVLFRGEKLMHWISSVTGGVRVILQIELCRV